MGSLFEKRERFMICDWWQVANRISLGKPLKEEKSLSDPNPKSKKPYKICRFCQRQFPHENRQDIERASRCKRFQPCLAQCHTLGAMFPVEERENCSHRIGKRHATYPPDMDGDCRIWRLQIDGEHAIRWMTRFNGVNRPSCIKV